MPTQCFEQVGNGKMHISDSPQAMADALDSLNKKGLRVVQFVRTPLDADTCFVHALCEKA